MSGSVFATTLPDSHAAPRRARHWVEAVMTEAEWDGPLDQLKLLVSELVSNAIRYSGDDVGLTVYVHECGVWVSVADDGAGRVKLRHAAPDEVSGRGLAIVDAVSGTWGVITERAGKSVWFELPDHPRA